MVAVETFGHLTRRSQVQPCSSGLQSGLQSCCRVAGRPAWIGYAAATERNASPAAPFERCCWPVDPLNPRGSWQSVVSGIPEGM